MGKVVCISGLVAVGKTTFALKVRDEAENLGLRTHFMGELYPPSVKAMLATNLQTEDAFMFAHRLQMGIDCPHLALSYDLVLMERSWLDHLAIVRALAATGKLSQEYRCWVEDVIREAQPAKPDCYTYLAVDPATANQRKQARSGSAVSTSTFSAQYQQILADEYSKVFQQYKVSVLTKNWDNFDRDFCYLEFLRSLEIP